MGRAVIGLHQWLADKDNFFYGQLTLVQYFHQAGKILASVHTHFEVLYGTFSLSQMSSPKACRL